MKKRIPWHMLSAILLCLCLSVTALADTVDEVAPETEYEIMEEEPIPDEEESELSLEESGEAMIEEDSTMDRADAQDPEIVPDDPETTTENPTIDDSKPTAPTDPAPSAPEFKEAACEWNGLKISWKRVSGADGYRLYRRNRSGEYKKVLDTTRRSYLDKLPVNGERCFYKVRAFRIVDGRKKMSDYSSAYSCYYMTAPVIQTIARQSTSETVTWTRNASASGYEIEYGTSRSFSRKATKTLTISSGKTLTASLKSLPANKSNFVRIRAFITKKGRTFRSSWSSYTCSVVWKNRWQFADRSKIHTGYTLYYQTSVKPSKRKNRIIAINAGHGTKGGMNVKTLSHPDGTPKVTGGTNGKGEIYSYAVSSGTDMLNGTMESTVTLALARVVKDKLLASGYDVLMIRESSDVQLDNIARTLMANNVADCHISLHYDDSTTDKGAFYCSVPKVSSYLKMYPVCDLYLAHTALGNSLLRGLKNAGVKLYSSNAALDLTQTSYSTIPSIDLEVGDRASDYSYTSLSRIANGIVKGLNEFYN